MIRCWTLALLLAVDPLWTAAQAPQLGQIVFPTSASGPAQAAFVRGVLYLHNFEYDEAILAFREAQKQMPAFAMAHWGEALSYTQPLWYNEDLARAREVLQRLAPTPQARLDRAPTPREKAYIAAIDALFGAGNRTERFQAFAGRLADIARRFPDDDEARVFEALALLGTIPEGERRPEISLRAGALAAAVLEKNPRHPGAAHYVLHAYDDGEHNAMALPAARIYAKIAPLSSHALHMPSHAFLPLGMWDEAVASDEASFNASVAWVARTGRTINQQDFHSLSWLHYEYLQQGRFRKARETADIVSRAMRAASQTTGSGPARPMSHDGEHRGSEIGRGYDVTALRNELANMRARAVIEGADWGSMKGRSSFDNVDELFALGLSSVGVEDYARADAALRELRKGIAGSRDRDSRELSSIMADELSALLAIARGRSDEGLALLSAAASREASRPKPIARPYPPKPAGELYAEALLGLGRPADAVAQYRRVLARTPRRPLSVLGLARASAAAGHPADARRAATEFLAIWHAADSDRPELAEARALAR